jgi:hypothetical protein
MQSKFGYLFWTVKAPKDNKSKKNSLGKKRRYSTYIKHIS